MQRLLEPGSVHSGYAHQPLRGPAAMTAVEIPEAPECAPWCEGHPNAEHGRWDDVHPFRGGVEVGMWCRHTTAVRSMDPPTAQPEVVVDRFASWSTEPDGRGGVERPRVVLQPYEFTPDQAEQLAAILLEAARLAR